MRRAPLLVLLSMGLAAAALMGSWSQPVHAFCGFYVSGAEGSLTNDATQVVLLRDGTRTVLSMQNSYKGPPSDFAMVVPVPVVLQKENVKTLEKKVFERVDELASPRLVEYWEQDPCPPPMPRYHGPYPRPMATASLAESAGVAHRSAVRIEAQFTVGEYDVVVLSANDSMALDTWLHQNHYKIPAGAEPYLRPYVQQGMRFFVAKVDVSKVKFDAHGAADLSPLRFHFDSDQFFLPIRLGLINSAGAQDLIVNILARNQRYEVTNYDNVAIPTNIDVTDATRNAFPGFYATLFDQTLAKHPHTVVTEYSWQATSCDPCPVDPLSDSELDVLGADVAPSLHPAGTDVAADAEAGVSAAPPPGGPPVRRGWRGGRGGFGGGSDFVLTRLHVRYTKDVLGDDLFFRAAAPIVGGREFVTQQGNAMKLEQGARPDSNNNFQARYVIRHPWTGPMRCAHPQRGVWGGPPGNRFGIQTHAAPKLADAPRGTVVLASLLAAPLAEETFLSSGGATPVLAIPRAPDDAAPGDAGPDLDGSGSTPPPVPPKSGCGGCTAAAPQSSVVGALGLVGLLALLARRRRRR